MPYGFIAATSVYSRSTGKTFPLVQIQVTMCNRWYCLRSGISLDRYSIWSQIGDNADRYLSAIGAPPPLHSCNRASLELTSGFYHMADSLSSVFSKKFQDFFRRSFFTVYGMESAPFPACYPVGISPISAPFPAMVYRVSPMPFTALIRDSSAVLFLPIALPMLLPTSALEHYSACLLPCLCDTLAPSLERL